MPFFPVLPSVELLGKLLTFHAFEIIPIPENGLNVIKSVIKKITMKCEISSCTHRHYTDANEGQVIFSDFQGRPGICYIHGFLDLRLMDFASP